MKLWEEKQEDEELTSAEVDLRQEERLRSKLLYKILLTTIKYTPIVILLTEVNYSILAYLCINTSWLSFIGSVSLVNLVYLYVASYVFRFCYLYRLSLHSIVLTNVLALIDTLVGIPISDLNILRVYLVILLTGVISFVGFRYKERRKSRAQRLS